MTVVYVLKDPTTLEVRYVGCSSNPRGRRTGHVQSVLNHPPSTIPVEVWKWRLRLRGLRPVFEIVAEFPSERSALVEENRLIAEYAAVHGPRLLNRWNHPQFKIVRFRPTRRIVFFTV